MANQSTSRDVGIGPAFPKHGDADPRPALQVPGGALKQRGWHRRGYPPHWDPGHRPLHVVLRLHDSLPQELLARWQRELPPTCTANEPWQQRIEAALDQGIGACRLRSPEIAAVIAGALAHFDGQRYHRHAWVIMPNHVHVLFTPLAPATLSSIMHSWKSFTAHRANQLCGGSGRFWQVETFDHVIRDAHEMSRTKAYIEANPVTAGLCRQPEDWPWSSATLPRTSGPHGDTEVR